MLGATGLAGAEPLDPALERLVVDPACHNGGPNPDPTKPFGAYTPTGGPANRPTACEPDNGAFARLVNQYGFALAPAAMHSARTTGFGGFHLSMEAVYTTIDGDARYWEDGTQGTRDPNTNQPSVKNTDPPGLLQVYSLKFRKGFGFGLELMGTVGFMPQTSIVTGGADVRISLFEGFRTGIPGYLPDLAVGGGVRTITGVSQFQLTTMGLDGQLSKPIAIADSSVITPWVGYQYLFIWGDSGLIDLTPATDAIQSCNYSGPAVPGNPDSGKTNGAGGDHVYDGGPVCEGGQPFDFNNNTVFDPVRLRRHRLMFGVNYRYEMVMVGAEFITDLMAPEKAQVDDESKEYLAGEDSQFSFVLELGAMF
ncbi:MAG TPA: hypothetical protein VGK73_16900 [Polyangiaceae bacterium]